MTCSHVRLLWLLVFTPGFLHFEWGHACNWYLAIACIRHWLEVFSCTGQTGDSALKLRWMDVLKNSVLAGCIQNHLVPRVGLWLQLTFFHIKLHSTNLLPFYQWMHPLAFSPLFWTVFPFPETIMRAIMILSFPFSLFKTVVFFVGNWNKSSVSANVL